MKGLLPFALLAATIGCGQRSAPSPLAKASPPFKGEPALKPVEFDLAGTWKVTRYQTAERPSKLSRWQRTWLLVRVPGMAEGCWADDQGKGVVLLTTGTPQMLLWADSDGRGEEHWFSVNDWSFGMLHLTGDNGELYLAVRTEGGEEPKGRGDDLPVDNLRARRQDAPEATDKDRPRMIRRSDREPDLAGLGEVGSVPAEPDATHHEDARYVDESRILKDYKNTGELGKRHPHIIIAGHKLDYDDKDDWYHFAGTEVRAMWLSVGGDKKTPPKRILAVTDRRLPDGTTEEYDPHNKRWIKVEKKLPPPAKRRQAP